MINLRNIYAIYYCKLETGGPFCERVKFTCSQGIICWLSYIRLGRPPPKQEELEEIKAGLGYSIVNYCKRLNINEETCNALI